MKLIELLTELKSYESMRDTLQGVYNHMTNPKANPGEKKNATSLYTVVLAGIAREYGDNEAEKAKAYVKRNARTGGSSSSSSRYRKKPEAKPRQKTNPYGSSDRGYSGAQSHVYTDPRTDWTFYVLRFTDPYAGKRGSDKVWGYATKDGKFMSFWGAYGKKVQTKMLRSDQEALKLFDQKLNKGYKRTDAGNNPVDYSYIFNQFD